MRSSRLRENSIYTQYYRWNLIYGADVRITPRCSKRPSSKAAGSGATEAYPEGTSQGDAGLRTPLANFFSILLDLPQPHWPIGLPGLVEFFHMAAEGGAEGGGKD